MKAFENAITLLQRCRAIIDDENAEASNRGEYGHINIVRNIDMFLDKAGEAVEEEQSKINQKYWAVVKENKKLEKQIRKYMVKTAKGLRKVK